MLDFFKYITGQGGFLILALLVIIAVIFKKVKQKRYMNAVHKKQNRKKH